MAVLNLSASALAVAKVRLGTASNSVEWIVADVTQWQSKTRHDVWHDRAAFQFLADPVQQQAYVEAMRLALASHGVAIIGTFAVDGSERCCCLTVARHDAASIAAIIGQDFQLVNEQRHEHLTPGDSVQQFQFSTFRRVG